MGLDMYLFKKDKEGKRDELMYWRKANAIHGYFIENVKSPIDNCEDVEITKGHLMDLLSICIYLSTKYIQKVCLYENADNKTKEKAKGEFKTIAESILPTQDGFFFGSTEYDLHYILDIADTIEGLTLIINGWEELTADGSKIVYYAWW